jgi:hypothetical protein
MTPHNQTVIEKLVENSARDWEVGNIDDAQSFKAWKRGLIKDILALLSSQRQEVVEEIEKILEGKKTGQNVIFNLIMRDKVGEANIENSRNNLLSDIQSKIKESL